MSKNKYLGKDQAKNELNFVINKKNTKDKDKIYSNGLNKVSEDNKLNLTNRSKVKLGDKKNDEKENNIKIIEEQNIEYTKRKSNNDDENERESRNNYIRKEDNSLSYKYRIKELEETIKKMNLEFSKEMKKHNDEISEKMNIINDKEICIQKLVNSNNNLKKSLETLTQRLDKILINTNIPKQKINSKIINEKQEDLQHQLDLKEKELKNQLQLIKILTKDNQHIRKILKDFDLNNVSNNNIDLTNKIHDQYHEIQKLQKENKELKAKNASLVQQKIEEKKINIKTDSPNKFNLKFFKNKNNKNYMNLTRNTGMNTHKLFANKSQNDLKIRKKIFYGIYSNEETFDPESIFSLEEAYILKTNFYDEQRYKKFLNKITILHKASVTKEKEMNRKVKIFENQLKQKEQEIKTLNEKAKEKDNKIIELNIHNKELKKIQDDLILKLNYLANELNQSEEKNKQILKQNEKIKNSIFSIDGILEAKSTDGNTIPLLVEVRKDSITIEKTKENKEEVKEEEKKE